jgi:heme/copper-type cytochrome/quinol oxidase subunit 2
MGFIMMKKWIRFSLLSIFLLSIFFSVSSVLAQQGTTSTTNKVWDIAYLALAISTILGIFVVILLLYFMNKYKEGSNANRRVVSHKFERNLEIVWIFASLILVVFATGVTLAYTGDIEAIRTEENVEKTIYVQGKQFGWDFFETLPDKSAMQGQFANQYIVVS